MLRNVSTPSKLQIDTTSFVNSLPTNALEVSHQLNENYQYRIIVWRKSSQDSSFQTEIVEKRKHERRNKQITRHDIIKVLHLSQIQACKILRCSLSTLKRRFYQLREEIGLDRWPQYFKEVRHLPIFNQMYPMSLDFILNEPNTEQEDVY